MKRAARIAFVRAVRTFSQTASAGLAGLVILALQPSALKVAGTVSVLALANAAIAAVVCFLQNFAEGLEE